MKLRKDNKKLLKTKIVSKKIKNKILRKGSGAKCLKTSKS